MPVWNLELRPLLVLSKHSTADHPAHIFVLLYFVCRFTKFSANAILKLKYELYRWVRMLYEAFNVCRFVLCVLIHRQISSQSKLPL